MRRFLLGRQTELIGLVVLVPIVLFSLKSLTWFIPCLWLVGLACLAYVYKTSEHPVWNWRAVNRRELLIILYRFVPLAILITGVVVIFLPETLLSLYQRDPGLWLMVMILYPVLSVLPQEIIYRSFVYARYRSMFSNPWTWIVISALAFAMGHLFLRNALAPVMTFFGGILFAMTYERTRSLALVSIEHALYGNFIFTLGLGRYFYHGAVHV